MCKKLIANIKKVLPILYFIYLCENEILLGGAKRNFDEIKEWSRSKEASQHSLFNCYVSDF